MHPIYPRIVDFDSYLQWMNYAGLYSDQLMESRDRAVTLLAHKDSIARLAAIESFNYFWYFDYPICKAFFALAVQDSDMVVRYTAAASLMLMHLRSQTPSDKVLLEQILCKILYESNVPEIVNDVTNYLQIMGPNSLERRQKGSGQVFWKT
jgi:hypothetical protein